MYSTYSVISWVFQSKSLDPSRSLGLSWKRKVTTELCKTDLDLWGHFRGENSHLITTSLKLFVVYTVELQWLEHYWDHEN